MNLKYFYSFLFGATLVLSFSPFNFWFFLFPSLTFLFIKSYNSVSKKEAFFIGWFFGFSFFIFGFYWIFNSFIIREGIFIYIMPICLFLFSGFLASFVGLISFLNYKFKSNNIILNIGFFSIFWTFSEILRGHIFTGFPWNLLAYTLSNYKALIQICSVIGVYGLSFLIIYSVLSISIFVLNFRIKKNLFLLISFFLIFSSVFYYGSNRIKNSNFDIVENKVIRVVQPNISQKDKLNLEKLEENYKAMVELSFKNKMGALNISENLNILWPETALHDFNDLKTYSVFKKLNTNLKDEEYVITGTFRNKKNNFYNSVGVINKNLSTSFLYDKVHLVPFGEYVPFSNFFNSLGFNFFSLKSGSFDQNIIKYKDLPSFKALICYEVIFPGKFVKKDKPMLIINFTNDAWFGNTIGPHQHFDSSIFRAIEEGRHLIRVANTGISASIDPFGKILNKIPLNTSGYFDTKIFLFKKDNKIMNTFFSEYKNNLIFLVLIILFFVLCILKYLIRYRNIN
ncbi:MAG: Apolipoprotein N-acyltransferase [Alphaproteobacteria bacterium MarineAlpha6_Bin4]|nr:MAG: Apolipoprotein N-acyltransferase [Alphaproteobacteria bacterium MarineAlpha6_Bin4]|tara:strand:+ start:8429 stop:9961 length:1533 start_codon:yes stop_codon:yes gene_type:complete